MAPTRRWAGSVTDHESPDRVNVPPRSEGGDHLTDLVLSTFHLNGLFLQVAEGFAKPVGLTAAWWQVLGAALRGPQTISGIARVTGLSRQAVQRTADVLVERGLAEYVDNPAHKRAKLLQPTVRARAAISDIRADQHVWANRVAEEVGANDLRQAVEVINRVAEVLQGNEGPPAMTGRPALLRTSTTP